MNYGQSQIHRRDLPGDATNRGQCGQCGQCGHGQTGSPSNIIRLTDDGFTLIEVMIALAILAALSVLTAQSMQTAIANRTKAKADVARESSVRDALSVIQADVAAAFHHRDLHTAMLNEITHAAPAPKPDPGTGLAPPAPPPAPADPSIASGTPRPTPVNLTGFVGDSESMYFTTLNHQRTTRDAKESDQAKVGYFLKSCKSRSNPKASAGSKCLYRSLSTVLDNDVTQAGPASLLLENVEEFTLRYIGPGSDDPVEQWKTGGAERDATKADNFPFAVEVTLTVHDKNDPKEKPFSATVLAPVRFPNNPPEKKEAGGSGEIPGA